MYCMGYGLLTGSWVAGKQQLKVTVCGSSVRHGGGGGGGGGGSILVVITVNFKLRMVLI